MTEEISKEPSIDSVVCFVVATLMKIYNEKEQAECVDFEEKRNTRKWVELNPVFKGDNQIKMQNKGSDDFRARFHPAKF